MLTRPLVDKRAVARSFGRAAISYDAAAHFQRWVADRLLAHVDAFTFPEQATVLDLGCGTGYCLSSFRRSWQTVGLDLSFGMLGVARGRAVPGVIGWLAADAEQLPFCDQAFDLVVSNLSIQWCSDITGLFRELCRVLKPGGTCCFSTLVEGTLHELKDAWAKADTAQHVNEFETELNYRTAINAAGFASADVECMTHVLKYASVRELLVELKAIGAHNVTPDRPRAVMPRGVYRAFDSAYQKFRAEDGLLPATYQILTGVLTRHHGSSRLGIEAMQR
jgi:malonyl-CoA O-methyltransferase